MLDIKIRSPWVASALCVFFFFFFLFRFSAPWGYRRDAAACSAGLAPMATITIQRPRRKSRARARTSLTLFFGPRPPPFVLHCVSSCWHRFRGLLHPASLRLPPRFNPFQPWPLLTSVKPRVSGIFSGDSRMRFYGGSLQEPVSPNPMMALTGMPFYISLYIRRFIDV